MGAHSQRKGEIPGRHTHVLRAGLTLALLKGRKRRDSKKLWSSREPLKVDCGWTSCSEHSKKPLEGFGKILGLT